VAFLAAIAIGAEACGSTAKPSTAEPVATTPAAARIVVDRSIGPVSIGMPERQVTRLLGRPVSRLRIESTPGHPGTLARYEAHGGELSIVYDSGRRVASIETDSPYYRTAAGLGPGSTLGLAARLPGFRQDSCDLGYWDATSRTPRRGVVTVFTPNGGLVESVLITQLRFDTNCDEGRQDLEPRSRIVVDRSIAGVFLGLAERAVVKRLGVPASTRPAALGPGATGTVARYALEGAPFLVTYDAGGHVVSIRSFSTSFFTPAGIGAGTPRALVAASHGLDVDPCHLGFWNGAGRAAPARPVTVFTLRKGLVSSTLITRRGLYARCVTR
jgi:hypothetical protein